MSKDKEEFKKRMIEEHGSEVTDAFFGAVENPELLQRVKDRTRSAAEEARKKRKKSVNKIHDHK